MVELYPPYRPRSIKTDLAFSIIQIHRDIPESISMSAGEAAELPSFLCFFGLLGLD